MSEKGQVILGTDVSVDDGVELGYLTGRKIKDHTLRIGDDACIRFGTVIYGGTTIGNRLRHRPQRHDPRRERDRRQLQRLELHHHRLRLQDRQQRQDPLQLLHRAVHRHRGQRVHGARA